MKNTKYIIYLSAKQGFFCKKNKSWPYLNGVKVTFELEKAKLYLTKQGAESAATGLYDELPQIMTVEEEITLTPKGCGDVITRSGVQAQIDARKNAEYNATREKVLAQYNAEQGISVK